MKKALILGTYVNPPYHPFQEVDGVLQTLLSPDFEITLTDDFSFLNRLTDFDLLVSYIDRFDQELPDGAGDAILSFVKQGGGLLCLHNGLSLQTDPRLFRLIGGKFLRHPPQRELAFVPTENGFLANEPGFTCSEEPYQFGLSGEGITPLLQYTFEGLTCLGGWARETGSGRIVFLTPGHSADVFRIEAYQRMILRSARWAAGI